MKAGTVIARRKVRDEAAPTIAKQQRERRTSQADGGLHAVDNSNTLPRTQQAHAATEVARPAKRRWRPASHLPALPAPSGFGLKWARRDGRDRGDCRGLARYIHEGWEPARKSDFPRHVLPTQTLADYGEVIGTGDMILMKMDEEMIAQRNEHYQTKRDTATHAVEKGSYGETSELMPALRPKRSSRTEFVRFRKRRPDAVEAAADDE